MSPPDDNITLRERVIIDETAKASAKIVMDMLMANYPPDEYGKTALEHALESYFDGIPPRTHLDHHKWTADAMVGDNNRELSWRTFWFDLASSGAKIVLGGILMLFGLGLLDWIKIFIKSK